MNDFSLSLLSDYPSISKAFNNMNDLHEVNKMQDKHMDLIITIKEPRNNDMTKTSKGATLAKLCLIYQLLYNRLSLEGMKSI